VCTVTQLEDGWTNGLAKQPVGAVFAVANTDYGGDGFTCVPIRWGLKRGFVECAGRAS
jgi:hypothetical protein